MKKNRPAIYILLFFTLVFSLVLTSCGKPADTAPTGSGIRVAFIYHEKSDENNWSHLHELGRQYLTEQLPEVETKYVENVSADDAEAALRDLAGEGYNLIFATAPEFSQAVRAVASEFPETKFEVCQGSQTASNVATYDGRMYQVFYLAGGFAGELTVTGKIGFIAPEPSVEVIRHVNAVALAARIIRAFENIQVLVKYTDSWSDPEANRQAATELVEEGADILIQNTYNPEVQKVAEEYGVRSFGYGFDMREFAPTMNATSIIWAWGRYYVERVQAVADGSWAGEAYFGKVANQEFGKGIVDFAPYTSDQIPTIIGATSMRSRTRFIETKRDVFEGPIKDQNGNLVLPKGEQYDDDYIYQDMDWFVEGVIGEAPGEPPPPLEN
jgi:basic membrane protein A